MKIAKWGNSLALRIPADVLQELGLKEGDEVDIRAAPGGVIELGSDARRRQAALDRIRAMARPLPPGYKFDRDEANAR